VRLEAAEMEEYILPGLIAVVSVPVFAAIVAIAFGICFLLVRRFAKPSQKGFLYTVCAVVLLPLPLIAASCLFMFLLGAHDMGIAQNVSYYDRGAENFWKWFRTIDDQLYVAKVDTDPAVQKMKIRLNEECPGLTFKLGPVHNGQRELAFIEDRKLEETEYDSQTKTNSRALIKIAQRNALTHWYTGFGFYKPKTMSSMEYGIGNQRIPIYSKDILFSASRNKNYIDVVVLTDARLLEDAGGLRETEAHLSTTPRGALRHEIEPVSTYLHGNLGEEFYGKILGNVTIGKLSGSKTSNAQTIDHIYQTFVKLMTTDERKEFNAIVTTQPCVHETLASNVGEGTGFPACQKSPYMRLRHQNGCCEP
jgi:hypothetical protein